MGENMDFPVKLLELFEKIALPKIDDEEWQSVYIKEKGDIYRIHKKILKLSDKSQWHTVIEEECADRNIDESFAILILRYYPEYYDVPPYEV